MQVNHIKLVSKFVFAIHLGAGLLLVGGGCNLESTSAVAPRVDATADEQDSQEQERGEILKPPADTLPANRDLTKIPLGLRGPFTDSKKQPRLAEVQLGRKLFFDVKLSRDGTVSCATCHRPDNAFATNQKVAVGVDGKVGTRNSPSLLNRVFGSAFFWDGRATSLEDQALQPITNENELANKMEAVLKYLKNDEDYVAAFEAAYAKDGATKDGVVKKENLARALSSFQRTLLLGNSPVDRFQAGGGGFELTIQEKQGLWLYESQGRCWKCHSGPNYSDEAFHNTGVEFRSNRKDLGRHSVTNSDDDRFRFKTPTLRGVALTAPYMHNGSIKSLREVVEFYNRGGSPKDPTRSDKIKPLKLTDEQVDALVAFLEALSREKSAYKVEGTSND